MLELPESYVISKQLKDTIHGKTIKQVITNRSPHRFAFYSGEPEYYSKLLNGKQITNVEAIAGQVELSAGNSKLVLNDGVNIRYLNKGEDLPKKHQLWMEFEDESSLVCTVQMYGGLCAFLEGENDNFYYLVAK